MSTRQRFLAGKMGHDHACNYQADLVGVFGTGRALSDI